MDEAALRGAIVDSARAMGALGLNQGHSGNISARWGDGMLITPSAMPYEAMQPGDLAVMGLDGERWTGPRKPSTEWRFHRDILRGRPDAGAVVHAHAPFCTALAITGRGIPACHYMIAVFGGDSVRCAPYATFGTAELAALALTALQDRHACLLANHGMITVGATLARAMWLAVELEALARQYYHSLLIGGPVLLDAGQMAAALQAIAGYA